MIRFVPIENMTDRPEELLEFDTTPQRTPAWFARRKAKVSGSRLSQLLFCKTEEEVNTYRRILQGLEKAEPLDAEALRRCQWGTIHEADCIHTLLENCPDMEVFEVGFELHRTQAWMGSSPDGIVRWPSRTPLLGVLECKCCTKLNKAGKTQPYSQVPYYYLPQVYWEMRCTGLSYAVFVCWGELETIAWHIPFDRSMWLAIYELVTSFMAGDLPYSSWTREVRQFCMYARAACNGFEKIGSWPSVHLCSSSHATE